MCIESISVTMNFIFLWCIETRLSFHNKHLNENFAPPYEILRALFSKQLILPVRPWESIGENYDAIEVFIIFFFFKMRVYRSFGKRI